MPFKVEGANLRGNLWGLGISSITQDTPLLLFCYLIPPLPVKTQNTWRPKNNSLTTHCFTKLHKSKFIIFLWQVAYFFSFHFSAIFSWFMTYDGTSNIHCIFVRCLLESFTLTLITLKFSCIMFYRPCLLLLTPVFSTYCSTLLTVIFRVNISLFSHVSLKMRFFPCIVFYDSCTVYLCT